MEKEKQPRENKSAPDLHSRDALLLLHDGVYVLAVIAVLFLFCFRVVRVRGDSMAPTLCEGDWVILCNALWNPEPETGDIVVVRAPDFSDEPLIKRIAALGGDTVDVEPDTGRIWINETLVEDGTPLWPAPKAQLLDFPVEIAPGYVFLLGDNRAVSYDSRYLAVGQVDQRNILGKVIFLAFPGRDSATGRRNYQRIGGLGQEALS